MKISTYILQIIKLVSKLPKAHTTYNCTLLVCPIQRVQIWGLDGCWKLGPIKRLHMDPHPVGANQTTLHGPASNWGQSNNSTWTCIQLGPIKQLHMDPHPIGANQTTPHGTDAGCLSMGHFPCGGTRLGQGVTFR
jgi:hypothetical protein